MHRQVKYLNNVIEADHGKLKQLIRPVRGFKTLKTAYATIMGFEVMRALRKGQAALFNLTQDIRGEARIVERAFGIGASALAEAIAVFSETLEPPACLTSAAGQRLGHPCPGLIVATEPDEISRNRLRKFADVGYADASRRTEICKL